MNDDIVERFIQFIFSVSSFASIEHTAMRALDYYHKVLAELAETKRDCEEVNSIAEYYKNRFVGLRSTLYRIATDNDCDPRAEARNALEGKDNE